MPDPLPLPPPGDAGTGSPGPRVAFGGDRWVFRGGSIELGSPRIMGILNLTPDSFSDGGLIKGVEDAAERAQAMVRAGADLVDVGGESTRPGAEAVSVTEELRRVLPFLEKVAPALGVPFSIDTRKSEVARVALEAGASVVNDVSALGYDPEMAPLVAEQGAGVVLMHMRGGPSTMMQMANYRDLLGEVGSELEASVRAALAAGVRRECIVLDPGLGFAKTPAQSLLLLRRLRELGSLGFPLLVGPSRKRFLGQVLGVPPEDRAVGTAAACVLAYLGGARLFRVHDVAPVTQALAVAHAVLTAASMETAEPDAAFQIQGNERQG